MRTPTWAHSAAFVDLLPPSVLTGPEVRRTQADNERIKKTILYIEGKGMALEVKHMFGTTIACN